MTLENRWYTWNTCECGIDDGNEDLASRLDLSADRQIHDLLEVLSIVHRLLDHRFLVAHYKVVLSAMPPYYTYTTLLQPLSPTMSFALVDNISLTM